jgi:hypothetical protein
MSLPGFSAQAALYQVNRFYRAATGIHSATAGVQPAMMVSCHCNGPDPTINWSCTCRWWVSPTCGGYATSYSDGTSESDHWCS